MPQIRKIITRIDIYPFGMNYSDWPKHQEVMSAAEQTFKKFKVKAESSRDLTVGHAEFKLEHGTALLLEINEESVIVTNMENGDVSKYDLVNYRGENCIPCCYATKGNCHYFFFLRDFNTIERKAFLLEKVL